MPEFMQRGKFFMQIFPLLKEGSPIFLTLQTE